MSDGRLPSGVLAVSAAPGAQVGLGGLLDRGLDRGLDVRRARHGGLALAAWGDTALPGPDDAVLLGLEVRAHDRALGAAEVRRALVEPRPAVLAAMLPPFAAVARDGESLRAAVDPLGLRQLYLRRGPGWVAVSTSARVLAALAATRLDLDAVAVQSRLGWQLGRRTLYAGVEQVEAGSLLTLRNGTLERVDVRPPVDDSPADVHATVAATRDLLRGYLDRWLDDHPDPVLQLTGGQDSRLLLSAIDPRRRRGLRVMTLGVEGSPDVAIAATIARREDLRHEVLRLDGLDDLDPATAWELTTAAAGRLELLADPVARAALDLAEADAEPGARLSGLGGEIARGFYYAGSHRGAPVSRRRAHRLAAWRMFANEAVDDRALDPDLAEHWRTVAHDEVHRWLAASGDPWLAATDRFYVEQRMQRWAGATETAVCDRTAVANPMLDDRFVRAVTLLDPEDKKHSRFLGRLSVALDPALADLPLDGRPSPRAHVDDGWRSALRRGRALAATGGRKATQRLADGRRPPAGGTRLTDLVADHWRRQPEVLEPVRRAGVLRPDWLDRVAAGDVRPDPATVALVANLTLAAAVVERRATLHASPS